MEVRAFKFYLRPINQKPPSFKFFKIKYMSIKIPFLIFGLLLSLITFSNCDTPETPVDDEDILGFSLLDKVTGHWVGSNETVYGTFDWFAFDFRPISASHVHSIYEGGTVQNIITSFFIADFEGKQQIMARNGGWLGTQYRATYFVLDKAEVSANSSYYRLVDAVGGEKRSYMELRFEGDVFKFDAYKDNSGALDDPVHHMGFEGTNYNPSFANKAIENFDFPQKISEVDLNNQLIDLVDPGSALFLEEDKDPFPKSDHGHLSDLTIQINRASSIENDALLFYLSKEPLVDETGIVNLDNLDKKVVRTINVKANESFYKTTYLHPDAYFLTMFSDKDGNFYPSTGDYSSVSMAFEVTPENNLETQLEINIQIP